MSSGIPVDAKGDAKYARRRRFRATTKVRAWHVETAFDKARSRAVQARTPDPDGAFARCAAVQDAERVVRELDADGRVFTRRDTGAQVRTRDTLAAAADPALLADRSDRYEVECLTHRGDPLFLDDAAAAARAARRSDVWCEGCRRLARVLRPVRGRARRGTNRRA